MVSRIRLSQSQIFEMAQQIAKDPIKLKKMSQAERKAVIKMMKVLQNNQPQVELKLSNKQFKHLTDCLKETPRAHKPSFRLVQIAKGFANALWRVSSAEVQKEVHAGIYPSILALDKKIDTVLRDISRINMQNNFLDTQKKAEGRFWTRLLKLPDEQRRDPAHYEKYFATIDDWEETIRKDADMKPETAKILLHHYADLREDLYAFQKLPNQKRAQSFVQKRKELIPFPSNLKISPDDKWREVKILQEEREKLARLQ